jgi:hypothetical protein
MKLVRTFEETGSLLKGLICVFGYKRIAKTVEVVQRVE